MRVPAVRNAIQNISEVIEQLPIHVLRSNDDGSKERVRGHRVEILLNGAANDFQSGQEFREAMTRDALLFDAGGVAFISHASDGRVLELIRLLPGNSSVELDDTDGSPIFRDSAGSVLPRRNVFSIHSPGFRSPVSDGREAIGLALAMEQYAARLFGNGARPSGILKFKSNMTPDALAKAKAAFQAAHSGEGSGGTAVMPGDAEFQALALTSTDAQFEELRRFQLLEIARVFRMNPIFLAELGRATWSNSAEFGRQFLTYTLTPWLRRWESEIAMKLLTPEERERGLFVEFETNAIVRADLATRADAYAKMIAAKVMKPNEARARENLPPDPDGDKLENPNTTSGGTPRNPSPNITNPGGDDDD